MNYVKTLKATVYLALVSLIISIIFVGYIPQQDDFLYFIVPYSIAFVCYYWIMKNVKHIGFNVLIIVAIVTRLGLLLAFPNLSDDIYRFIWDGRLMQLGISPYGILPSEVKGQYDILSEGLYYKLNSPNYYTIYPPVTQLFNYLSTIPKTVSMETEIFIYKALIFICEMALMRSIFILLKSNELSPNRLFIYALNPLIIIEISNNLHFEGVMILFFITALLIINNKNHIIKTATLISLSIASKLLPLMFLPILLFNRIKKGEYKLTVYIGIITVLLFLPILLFNDQLGIDQLKSLDLYLKKFEFNGSIYYALRSVGYMIYGYNLIHVLGPILTVLALIAILIISYRDKSIDLKSLSIKLLVITSIFLLTSRTVHPWYLSLAIVFCSFNHYRFPIVWSYLIGWTYINYSFPVYQEQLWLVSIEYTIVLTMIYYEYRSHKKRPITM